MFQNILEKCREWHYNIFNNKLPEKQMRLVTKLDNLGAEVLERFPNINFGGCGVFATMVMLELKKHNIDATCMVAAWSADESNVTIDDVRPKIEKKNIFSWNNNGISFNHVGVEFKINGRRMHYDTHGAKPAKKLFDEMPIYKGRLTYKEIRTLSSVQEGWNTQFDRKQIPALRRLVKKHLKTNRKMKANNE